MKPVGLRELCRLGCMYGKRGVLSMCCCVCFFPGAGVLSHFMLVTVACDVAGFPKLMDAKSKSLSVGRNGPKVLPSAHKNGQINPGTPEPSRRPKTSGNFVGGSTSCFFVSCVLSHAVENSWVWGQSRFRCEIIFCTEEKFAGSQLSV